MVAGSNEKRVALTELAQQAGLPNSRLTVLLTTMRQQGLSARVGERWAAGRRRTRVYRPVAASYRGRNLLAIVHPILRKLMEDSGETVNLAVLDQSDHQAIIIDPVQCTQLMRMSPVAAGTYARLWRQARRFIRPGRETGYQSAAPQGCAYTHATLVCRCIRKMTSPKHASAAIR